MRAKDRRSGGALVAPLVAMILGLVALGGTMEMFHRADRLGARVGDQIAFDLDPKSHVAIQERLAVDRSDGTRCVLDIEVMQNSGGSLIVEERGAEPKRLYRVHWSGRQTSTDGANCGSSADLRMTDPDIATLAEAAGGYGLTRRRLVLTTPWVSAGASRP